MDRSSRLNPFAQRKGPADREQRDPTRGRSAYISAQRSAIVVLTALMLCGPRIALSETTAPDLLAEQALAEIPAGDDLNAAKAMSIPWLELIFRGGWLMVPIALISVMVVALAIERAISLRRTRLAPRLLTTRLHAIATSNAIDAQQVEQICRESPSVLGRVILTMLSRRGCPTNEIEQALRDTCEREADEMYGPVRTIHLATSVAPLLGLLGTVLGMIEAFFATANLAVGVSRSQALAEGIYVALITTCAGLSVAIPAAVLAHVFEARILHHLRDIERIATELLPQITHRPDDTIQSPHFRSGETTITALAPSAKAS